MAITTQTAIPGSQAWPPILKDTPGIGDRRQDRKRCTASTASRFSSRTRWPAPLKIWMSALGMKCRHNSANCIRRGHHAVDGVVMLVHNYSVEAQLIGEQKLRQITLVECMARFRIIIFVREIDPRRSVILMIFRQVHLRHKVHKIKANRATHREPPWPRADPADAKNWVRRFWTFCSERPRTATPSTAILFRAGLPRKRHRQIGMSRQRDWLGRTCSTHSVR